MYDENPHRNFWIWVACWFVFSGTYLGVGIAAGFDLSMVMSGLLPKPMAIGLCSAYGAFLFRLNNEAELPYSIGLFSYSIATIFLSWAMATDVMGLYFSPFILVFTWLVSQWFVTTIPD